MLYFFKEYFAYINLYCFIGEVNNFGKKAVSIKTFSFLVEKQCWPHFNTNLKWLHVCCLTLTPLLFSCMYICSVYIYVHVWSSTYSHGAPGSSTDTFLDNLPLITLVINL